MDTNKQPSTLILQPGIRVWLLWFLSTTISGVISWAVGMLAVALTWGLALPLVFTVLGIFVGGSQWLVLKPRVREIHGLWKQLRWVLLSAAGATLSWFLVVYIRASAALLDSGLLLHPMLPVVNFFCGGFIFGLVQWQTWSSSRFQVQLLWALSNAVGWSIGAFIGLRASGEILAGNYRSSTLIGFPDAAFMFVAGSVGIVAFSIITGVGMLIIMRSYQQELSVK